MLHIGGVRTALFSWLYARRHGGVFILRVEDTDRERSTEEATQVILDGMEWLGLTADEGPFYQTRRMDRYREVLDRFLRIGAAYRCYCSKEELEEMRNRQIAAKLKPRYEQNADYISREIFEDILESEEEHIDWLETQLGLIERIGLENYCQTQIEACES